MNWKQLVYQYGFGSAYFFLTFYLCFRPGASDWQNPSDRKAFIYLLAGLFGYFIFHTLWIILASR